LVDVKRHSIRPVVLSRPRDQPTNYRPIIFCRELTSLVTDSRFSIKDCEADSEWPSPDDLHGQRDHTQRRWL